MDIGYWIVNREYFNRVAIATATLIATLKSAPVKGRYPGSLPWEKIKIFPARLRAQTSDVADAVALQDPLMVDLSRNLL